MFAWDISQKGVTLGAYYKLLYDEETCACMLTVVNIHDCFSNACTKKYGEGDYSFGWN